MRIVLLALTGAALLAGCDSSVATFGKSFDECILKNARQGGDRASRDAATEICERRFVRPATEAEQKDFGIGTDIRFDSPTYGGGQEDYVIVGVQSKNPNLILKEVETVVEFYKAPRGPDGKFKSSDYLATSTWNLTPEIAPYDYQAVGSGTFNGSRAPSRFWTARTVVTKVLPLQ